MYLMVLNGEHVGLSKRGACRLDEAGRKATQRRRAGERVRALFPSNGSYHECVFVKEGIGAPVTNTRTITGASLTKARAL
jgi:hypothetical protein